MTTHKLPAPLKISTYIAFIGGIVTPALETIRRWNQLSDPQYFINWFDDYIIGAFLLIAASVYFIFVLPINKLMARFFPAKGEPPKTRPCPECLSDIPLEAKRCSHCAQLVA